jgi:hypothetical protein
MSKAPNAKDRRPCLTVSLTRPQLEWLRKRAQCFGMSVSDLIRCAVDDYREIHEMRMEAAREVGGRQRHEKC